MGALALFGATACSKQETTDAEALGELPTACTDDPLKECAEPEPNALSLNREEDLGVVRAELVDDEKGTVEIELLPSSVLFDRLTKGRVVYRNREGRKPILRRIEEVTREGNTLTVRTTRARLKDAFTRGRIHRKVKVDTKELAMQGVGPQPASADGEPIGSSSQALSWGCNVTIPLVVVPVGAGSASAGMKDCSVGLDLDIDVDGDWGFGAGDFAEITATGTVTAGTTAYIDAGASVTAGGEKTLAGYKIPTGVPGVSVDVDLIVGAGLVTNAAIHAEAGFDYEGSLTAGVGYQMGDGFYTVWDPQSTFSERPPSFEFTGTLAAEVYIKPHIGLVALESLEGFIEAKAFAGLTITSSVEGMAALSPGKVEVDSKVCYDLSVGLAPIVGAELSVVGLVKLAEYSYTPFVVETSLLNECVAATSVEDTSCKASDECVVSADCTPPDVCSAPACTSNCTCAFKKIPGCCLTDAECKPEGETYTGKVGGLTTYACVSNQCVARAGQALCNTNADCDDGVKGTVDTCVHPGQVGLARCKHTVNTALGYTPPLACLVPADTCDDGDPSTLDACTLDGCVHTPLPPCGGTCNDGDPSTSDTCLAGVCKHDALPKLNKPMPGKM